MTIKDFENHIDPKILQRGYEYFLNNSVDSLEDAGSGLWFARVFGTETYSVEVKTTRTQIKHWECDCPYDYGDVCKHTVAVLYAIAEEKDIVKEVKTETKNHFHKEVEKIFKTVSKEELKRFLTTQFSKYKTLKDEFVSHFVEYLEQNDIEKLRTIVKSNIKIAKGNSNRIDKKKVKKLYASLDTLLKEATKQLQQDNIIDTINTVKVLIEELNLPQNDFLEERDDIIFEAFKIFNLLVEKAPPMLKDELFEYCIEENKKSHYYYFGNVYFIELMVNIITINSQEKQWFELIDKQIKKMKKNHYHTYHIPRVLYAKYEYLKIHKKVEVVDEFLNTYNNYGDFRAIQVSNYIERKEYKKAQNLCLEIIENNPQRSVQDIWLEKMLLIGEKTKDTKEIRKWANQLFIATRYDFKYYNKLKATYSTKEWKSIYEGIIKQLSEKSYWGNILHPYEIANIYFLEKENEKLLQFFNNNVPQFNFIHKHVEMIIETYPKQAIKVYEKAIFIHAKNTGRSYYRDIERALKKMNKLSGGSKKVIEIVNTLKEEYKNRPAMISILNKSFG